MIRFEHVTKTYAGGSVKAVDDLNLEIDGKGVRLPRPQRRRENDHDKNDDRYPQPG